MIVTSTQFEVVGGDVDVGPMEEVGAVADKQPTGLLEPTSKSRNSRMPGRVEAMAVVEAEKRHQTLGCNAMVFPMTMMMTAEEVMAD